MNQIGVVVIGRNEGERLVRCLDSVLSVTRRVVYVDSGSTDGSVMHTRERGVEVLELDMTVPFTAARARNAGCDWLMQHMPEAKYVQFVDGDCEIIDGWLEAAAGFLEENAGIAMICGRLRERYPDKTVYNMLCDTEWEAPAGQARACGGNSMVRISAFAEAAGFRPDLIAGEESELCLRLRDKGWKVWRLTQDMAWHDAAMTRFSQWWKRSRRTGYAYAEGAYLHGASPERHRITESRRIWLWGIGIPLLAGMLATVMHYWAALILLLYPVQIIRVALKGRRARRENWMRAFFLVLGKFPEAAGQLSFLYNRLTRKRARLIEYK